MAHFVKINSNTNKVERGIVVSDKDCGDLDFPESEKIGSDFIKNTLKLKGTWKQTSYNNNFRVRYAGIGFTYDEVNDAFIPPKPHLSWVLNDTTLDWEAPIPMPNDGKYYAWNESILNWIDLSSQDTTEENSI